MADLLFLVLGIAALSLGGEALIRGSLAAARRLGVSPLLSGLVIVGFGTSAPELVVSIDAAMSERADIATGNVVGSNIGNMLLILGMCALIAPLRVKPLALRRDAATSVAACVLFVVLVDDRELMRTDAAILATALVAYLVWVYWTERDHDSPSADLHKAEATEVTSVPESLTWTGVTIIAGLLMLVGGSQVLLIGATGIAAQVGVSEAVVGLTLVAVGTSLPELSVSVIASLRRHTDVAIGNVLGSNIFNLLGILSVSALVQPLPVPTRILQFDQWIMLGTSLLLLLFLYTGRHLSRMEGGIFLVGYGAYVALSFTVFGN